MKIDPDDPKLTAYALGELGEPERSEVAAAVAQSAEAQAFVRETQQMARMLRGELQQELRDAAAKPLNIMPLPEERASWPETRWSSLGLAAVLAVGALVAAVVIVGLRSDPDLRTAGRSNRPPLEIEFDLAPESAADALANGPAQSDEDPFVAVASHGVSTFPLRPGARSYRDVRRQIEAGIRPAREKVRIEELINHFEYEYPAPGDGRAFAIAIEAATCPWQTAHELIRIGVKGREEPSGGVIARDATVEVRFDPARVASYRLIGYERGAASGADIDRERGTDIPAGHTATALYEVVPLQPAAAGSTQADGVALVDVTLSYRPAETDSRKAVVASFNGGGNHFEQASADFRFAAAVAQFGMILRDSPHRGSATMATLATWAGDAIGADASGERTAFLQTLQKTQALLF